MNQRRPGLAVFAVTAAAFCMGCGGALYAIQVNSASSKVAQAKELGAEKLAPYEYFYASEHLNKAMSEAAEGDYSDANDFAGVAEEYADKAIKLAKEAHRGAGR
jgi:hypothetical protein